MKDLKSQLEGVKTAAIAGHIRPDGDCVGSCLATYQYLKRYHTEISVTLYLEEIPNKFKFLAGADEIVHSCEEEKTYDLFIAQDCGDIERLGDAARYFKTAKKTICIDHHISNSSFAAINYIFPNASSTSELVFGLIGEENVTKEIAECIYLGIVHDTGVFQYSCATAKTMEVAGKLMEKGIPFSKIIDDTFYTKTFEQNKIMGKALLACERYSNDRIIASVVTAQDMETYHVLPRHLDGIVNQLRITRGVEAAIFLYESGSHSYKVSARSNGRVDVAAIAVKFGGGGHTRAAGFSIQGTLEEIMKTIVLEIEKQL